MPAWMSTLNLLDLSHHRNYCYMHYPPRLQILYNSEVSYLIIVNYMSYMYTKVRMTGKTGNEAAFLHGSDDYQLL